MSVAELVLLSIFCTIADISNAGTPFAGPFDYVIREIVDCEDKGLGSILFENKVMRKISRTNYVISVDIIINNVSLSDEENGVTARFSVWGNGGWRPNFMILSFKEVCKTINEKMPDVFKQIATAANRTSCPIPPGEYKIVDAPGLQMVDFPSLPYNKYKLNFEFTAKEGVVIGCVGLVADVVPKEKKKKG
ncbi:hypothetical protein GE061_014383 [Apolygus lucorum]|uniref:MD-2-related lipid-recognition domain-containing protein n=1 Tax=Apolygus lucorum TaxID=248454 RepID=A0A8S9XT50_APOLU|nr:hypothetical protein GE061_014383 [Apolygus lucorum]